MNDAVDFKKYADNIIRQFISSIYDRSYIVNLMVVIDKAIRRFRSIHRFTGVTEVVNVVSEEQYRRYDSDYAIYSELEYPVSRVVEKSIIYTVVHEKTSRSSFIRYYVYPYFDIHYGWVDGVLYVDKENIVYTIVKSLSDIRQLIDVFDNFVNDIEKNYNITIASIDVTVFGGVEAYIGNEYEISEDRGIYISVYDEKDNPILSAYIGYLSKKENIFGAYIKSFYGYELFQIIGAINRGRIDTITKLYRSYCDENCKKYLKLTEKFLSLVSNNILCYKLLEPYTILLHVVI